MRQKKKINREIIEKNKEITLIKLILEYKKSGYSNDKIKEKLTEKNYPKEFVEYMSELNTREVKMEKEEYDEFDEDEALEKSEGGVDTEKVDTEKVDTEKIEPEKVEKVKKEVKEDAKLPTLHKLTTTVNGLINAFNDFAPRLESVEASLYRIKNF